MAIKIDKEIVGYSVSKESVEPINRGGVNKARRKTDNVVQMHERLERP